MDILIWMIPLALFLGGLGLWAFIWSMRSGFSISSSDSSELQ